VDRAKQLVRGHAIEPYGPKASGCTNVAACVEDDPFHVPRELNTPKSCQRARTLFDATERASVR